jgi:hypothetical protein
MATITLDDIRAEAERRYAPTVVKLSDGSKCVLQNILDLDQKVSEKVDKALKALSATGDDDGISSTRENAVELLHLIGKGNVDQLIEDLGGTLARIIILIEKWSEASQVGEASPSDG